VRFRGARKRKGARRCPFLWRLIRVFRLVSVRRKSQLRGLGPAFVGLKGSIYLVSEKNIARKCSGTLVADSNIKNLSFHD